MKKQLNYADIIKEALILTGAVAIIAEIGRASCRERV